MNELIQKLSQEHGKKPFWKNKFVLFVGWPLFNFIYFLMLGLPGNTLTLNSTIIFPSIMFLLSLGSWLFFIQLLNQENKKSIWLFPLIAFLFICTGLVYENFSANTIIHDRSFSVTSGDLNCFYHSVLRSLLPALMFPFLMKQFYVIQKNTAIILGAIHLTMMSLILTELRCANREMWHLVLGHQSAVIGVGVMMFCFLFLIKKKVF